MEVHVSHCMHKRTKQRFLRAKFLEYIIYKEINEVILKNQAKKVYASGLVNKGIYKNT